MLSVFRMVDSPNQNEHEVLCVLELAGHAEMITECQSCRKKSRSAYGIAFYTHCPLREVSVEKKDAYERGASTS